MSPFRGWQAKLKARTPVMALRGDDVAEKD
jgi:hypothetical protein